MNKIKNLLAIPVIIISFVPLLIMLPVGILAVLVDLPHRRKGYKEMKLEFKKNWLPNKKYIYLHFDTERAEDDIKNYIKNEYIPKYKKYLIVDTSNNGTVKESQYAIAARQIFDYHIAGFSGETDAVIVTLNKQLDIKASWPIYKQSSFEVAIKETKEIFIEETERCLKEWEVEYEN